MRKIPLSQGRSALVDDDDFEWLSSSRWFYRPAYDGKPATAMRSIRKPDGTATTEYLSRAVMQSPPDMRVIFLNYDTLDCRKDNLRLIDRAYAQRRSRVRSDSLSGIKGVKFNRSSGTWKATLCRRGRRITLGTFPSPEEAAAAYRHAAEEWEVVHGEPMHPTQIPPLQKAVQHRSASPQIALNPSPPNPFRDRKHWNVPAGGHRGLRSRKKPNAHHTNTRKGH